MPSNAKPSAVLSHALVAYHFCQADNAPTCLVPEFVHSLAAQLAQAPQLQPYYQLLQAEPALQAALSLSSCTRDPGTALLTGVLDPLARLTSSGALTLPPPGWALLVVDALCEAEQHRPDYGHTLVYQLLQEFFVSITVPQYRPPSSPSTRPACPPG